jgi:hypothetical protein
MNIKDAFDQSPYQVKKHSSYFASYERLFTPYKGKPITFVEVGILNGGSLFMWRKFWGEDVRIIGIDLNPEAKKWEAEGFEIFIGDQADSSFWERFFEDIGAIDILLDDGGHTFEQQIVTYQNALPHMKDGGLLVVEDTHTSFMHDFGGPSRYSFMSFAKNIADGIHYRSGNIAKANYETQVASINFYESIIAFYIDRQIAGAKSTPVVNEGQNFGAMDYRHADSTIGSSLNHLTHKYVHLKRMPLIGPLLASSWKFLQKTLLWLLSKRRILTLGNYFKY